MSLCFSRANVALVVLVLVGLAHGAITFTTLVVVLSPGVRVRATTRGAKPRGFANHGLVQVKATGIAKGSKTLVT